MSPWHTERMISDWMNSVDGALLAVWLRGLTDCSIVVAFWVSGTWGASTSSPAENTKSWLCLTALLLPAGSQRQCSRRDKITKVLMSCIRQVLLHWSDSTWETVSPICINYWMDGGNGGYAATWQECPCLKWRKGVAPPVCYVISLIKYWINLLLWSKLSWIRWGSICCIVV